MSVHYVKEIQGMSGRMPDQFPDALQNKMSDSMSEYVSKYMSDKMSGCMPDRMPDKGGIECQLVGITRRTCFILAWRVYLSRCS